MFSRKKLNNLEKDLLAYIQAYFTDIVANFDVYKPVYELIIKKTMMEPSIDALLCYIMGQVVGIVNIQLELAGLSVDEKADITESLYREIQVSIVKLRENLEKQKFM